MRPDRLTLPIFSATLFLSAALLFLLQLIYARLVLPLLGGAPAVWNTAMTFYQTVLLVGYGYAHLISSHLRPRTQWLVHAAVLVAPVCVLPFAVPASWVPPTDANPVPWLLGLLALGVGLPCFAVSTLSPLLQSWFTRSGHPDAQDPYFLYAASNAGSLLGLLGYPFLVEPHTTLSTQALGWTWAYGLLVALVLLCGFIATRALPATPVVSPHADSAPAGPRPTTLLRLRWMGCAFVPSSLLLSVTSYLCSDIAAVPLLWVLPLSLYLLTFVVAFARRPWMSHTVAQRILRLLLIPVVAALAAGLSTPVVVVASLHLIAFFFAALVCHGELSQARPDSRSLTEFYLWISLGGALGGSFNSLLAPVLFDRLIEYPLLIALLALLAADKTPRSRLFGVWSGLWALIPIGLAVLLAVITGVRDAESHPAIATLAYGVPAIACLFLVHRRVSFALGVAGVLAVAQVWPAGMGRVRVTHRSFFGVHRVALDSTERFVRLMHGRIIHGMQYRDPARRNEALTYYHATGPIGHVFSAWGATLQGPIAAVGLGAGTVARYGKPGQEFTFFEIDPVVARIASDPAHFTFLRDSPARINLVLGDARLTLRQAPESHYQLLILDAYSSDSVPVHLVTREAFDLYLKILRPDGVMALHLSNLHLDLVAVMATLARDAGLVCRLCDDREVSSAEQAEGKFPSQWMVIARREADLTPLRGDPRWTPGPDTTGLSVWTDDYSSVVRVLKLGLH